MGLIFKGRKRFKQKESQDEKGLSDFNGFVDPDRWHIGMGSLSGRYCRYRDL
jgi:hypothetical protein